VARLVVPVLRDAAQAVLAAQEEFRADDHRRRAQAVRELVEREDLRARLVRAHGGHAALAGQVDAAGGGRGRRCKHPM
jgi:hypothetical protein